MMGSRVFCAPTTLPFPPHLIVSWLMFKKESCPCQEGRGDVERAVWKFLLALAQVPLHVPLANSLQRRQKKSIMLLIFCLSCPHWVPISFMHAPHLSHHLDTVLNASIIFSWWAGLIHWVVEIPELGERCYLDQRLSLLTQVPGEIYTHIQKSSGGKTDYETNRNKTKHQIVSPQIDKDCHCITQHVLSSQCTLNHLQKYVQCLLVYWIKQMYTNSACFKAIVLLLQLTPSLDLILKVPTLNNFIWRDSPDSDIRSPWFPSSRLSLEDPQASLKHAYGMIVALGTT